MTTYVALLRGIGPTNPNMRAEKLKGVFEELGFNSVQTVLGSGNVIFDSSSKDTAALELAIEKALPEKLGFNSKTIVRSQAYLKNLLNQNPFGELEHNKETYLLITFFKNPTVVPFELPYTPDNKPYTVVGSNDQVLFGKVNLELDKTPAYMIWLEKIFGKEITSRTPKSIELIVKKMAKP